MNKIKLIIGLGNPGKEYKNTYHGVGFLFIDYLTAISRRMKRQKKPAEFFYFAQDNASDQTVSSRSTKYAMALLLKSNTYMNQSGSFVKDNLKKHRLKPEQILIVHDDSDLQIGRYKLSFGRGSAGHKGIDSIIKSLKTKNFWRLRIGIRPKEPMDSISPTETTKTGLPRRLKAGDFVLKKISAADRKILETVFIAFMAEKS